MENYKMTAIDIETGMEDVYRTTVEKVNHSKSWAWKTVGAIAFIVLCVAATIFFVWDLTSQGERESLTAEKNSATMADRQEMLLQRIAKNTKAAIHLRFSGPMNDNKTLQWMSGVDQSFSQGGLELEDNTITIPSNGLYFVYSQASFVVSCKENGGELTYSILWSSPASPSTDRPYYLLEGIRSLCHTSTDGHNDDQMYDNIYLGAVFMLFKGDRLSTETSHPMNIDDHSSKTFFGVFKL